MEPIQIFVPGKHTDMSGQALSFSETDLKASAAAYDPKVHEAPIVVGHPQSDAPAYGWIKSVAFAEGALTAIPDQVDPAFAEMVGAGRFKKVSASFYTPDGVSNPKPGVYYLRHVGFLGAQPPSVKGLKPVAFADAGAGVVTIEFNEPIAGTLSWALRNIAGALSSIRDIFVERDGIEKTDRILPSWRVDEVFAAASEVAKSVEPRPAFSESNKEKLTMPDPTVPTAAALAAQETAIAEEKKKLDKDRADFAEAKRRDQVTAAIDELVKAGKVLPAEKPGLVAFMTALDDKDTVQFGEGEAGKKTPAAFMADFLKGLPARVDFKERSAETDQVAGTASFTAPAGFTADPAKVDIHNKAIAYQEAHQGTDYITAVKAVGGN